MNSIYLSIILLPTLLNFISYFIFRTEKEALGKSIFAVSSILTAAAVSTIWILALQGTSILSITEAFGLGFSLKLDGLTTVVYAMVSVIAYFVLRFSYNYLEGDLKKAQFLSRIVAIVASVQLLVLSGNLFMFFLAWIFTSLELQGLLGIYKERIKAYRASRIKFIIARSSDLSLLLSFILLYIEFGTADISSILSSINEIGYSNSNVQLAALFLSIAAILKSVQFPFHTWILGVLELPTPASALLHAGLLNAGPFLIIRFALLYLNVPTGSYVLIFFGTISALFGTIVQVTQPSVKTALVYSSVGHMGFSLLLCGLGLYAAALVHLVSHSFYKAYSFLNAGSVIEQAKRINYKAFNRRGNKALLLLSFIIGIGLLTAINLIAIKQFSINENVVFVGNIVLIGVFALNLQMIDSNSGFRPIITSMLLSLLVLTSFFLLEEVTSYLLIGLIPSIYSHSAVLMIGLVLIFYIVSWIQILLAIPKIKQKMHAFQVHARNGFYLDSMVNRLAGLF